MMVLDNEGKLPIDYVYMYKDTVLRDKVLSLLNKSENFWNVLCYSNSQGEEEQPIPSRETRFEWWARQLPVFFTYLLTKIVMAATVYYIYPHIGMNAHKLILFVFFILVEVTYVAVSFSKPVYLNDVDFLTVSNDLDGKVVQLLKRYDSSEICPHCELVMRN